MFNKIAILYSFEQKSFHTETLLQYIGSNIEHTNKLTVNQFSLVGITDTYDQAIPIIESLRKNYNWL